VSTGVTVNQYLSCHFGCVCLYAQHVGVTSARRAVQQPISDTYI